MKHFTTRSATTEFLLRQRSCGYSIGFVPTMGALHAGHLQLVARSKQENDLTVCSIFINPIQFNNPADLEKYPRNPAGDAELLDKAGCDVLFSPTAGEMYPAGESMEPGVDLGVLDQVMEGYFRPGHFKGVALVVRKLFAIVLPDRAYFGKKDYQQLAVIRYMTESLRLPVTIVPCETVREADGLAMSSRNVRLTARQRASAPGIYAILKAVKEKAGTMTVEELKSWAIRKFEQNPEFRLEYFEIADRYTLLPVTGPAANGRAVALTAVYMGDVRLIDNMELF